MGGSVRKVTPSHAAHGCGPRTGRLSLSTRARQPNPNYRTFYEAPASIPPARHSHKTRKEP